MSYTTEHTPGPWRQGTTAEGHTEVYGPDVGGGPGQEITVAQAWGNRPGEATANARLIAAAPLMLEALEAVLPELLEMAGYISDRDAGHKRIVKAVKMVDQALAAVRGGEPAASGGEGDG